jgi:FkbM family methyltransferase
MIAAAKRFARAVTPLPVYGEYRRQRIRHQIRRYRPRIVRHTYGNHDLTISLEDPLAQGWYDRDWRQLAELDFLAEHLPRGARVLDLGAHQGVVALMLARTVDPGVVIAVEAEPHNARVADTNRRLNEATNLTIVNAAVAERNGTVFFAEELNGHVDQSSRGGTVEVPAVTIDELVRRYGAPDVLFMDIEGYEYKALQAARQALAARPACFVEVHTPWLGDAGPEQVLDMFSGYQLYAAADDQSREFRPLNQCRELLADRFFLVALP